MPDDALVAEVAASTMLVLGFAGTPSDRVSEAAAASVMLARRYCYADVVPPPELPTAATGPDFYAGLVALAVRVYHDPASPSGVVGADAYVGAAIPEDVLAHVHHYFNPYRMSWGIA